MGRSSPLCVACLLSMATLPQGAVQREEICSLLPGGAPLRRTRPDWPLNKGTRLCISLASRPMNPGSRLHSLLYRELGLDVYEVFTTLDLPTALAGIRGLGICGCGGMAKAVAGASIDAGIGIRACLMPRTHRFAMSR
jgi:shikimate 5-dehydrogenase